MPSGQAIWLDAEVVSVLMGWQAATSTPAAE